MELYDLKNSKLIKMKCIGNVGDILRPSPTMREDYITVMDEPLKSIIGKERDEVDGQTILFLASVEEMHQYDARQESESQQFTLSLSPSPCPSLTSSIPPQSQVPTSNVSESLPSTVFSESVDIPRTSMETAGEVKEFAEKGPNQKDEIVENKEVKKEELSAAIQGEQPKPVIELKSELVGFAQFAVSAVSIPSLELTGSGSKKSDVTESKSSEDSPLTSRKRKRSERVPAELPTTSKANNDRFSENHLGHNISPPPPRSSSKNSKGSRITRPSSPLERSSPFSTDDTKSCKKVTTKVPKKKQTPKKKVTKKALPQEPAREPVVNTSSRLRQLLQEERSNLPKLIPEEMRPLTRPDEVQRNTAEFDEKRKEVEEKLGQIRQKLKWISEMNRKQID